MYSLISFILKVISIFFQWLAELLKKILPNMPGPHVTAVDPYYTSPGSVIDIIGGGFDPALDGNAVMVGGKPARIIRASATTLKVIIDLEAQDGPITVTTGNLTVTSPNDFKARPYPSPDSGEDGPPSYFEGALDLQQGDLPSTGTLRVLVVLVNPTDVVPANPANARTEVVNRWNTVRTFYDQASFTDLNVQADVTTGWNTPLQNRAY